jgi:hypothetical protein
MPSILTKTERALAPCELRELRLRRQSIRGYRGRVHKLYATMLFDQAWKEAVEERIAAQSLALILLSHARERDWNYEE